MSLNLRILVTDCATTAVGIARGTTMSFTRLYYKLTKHIPRPIPRNSKELMRFKHIAKTYYGLRDSPDVWHTVMGHLASTPSLKLWKSYADSINPGLRLDINKVAHTEKLVAQRELEAMLDSIMKKELQEEARFMDHTDKSNGEAKSYENETAIEPKWSDVPGTAPGVQ